MADKLTELATQYTYDSKVVTVAGSNVSIPYLADAKRVAILFSNGGTGPVQVNFGPPADLTKPIHVHPGQRPTLLRFSELGPLVQQQVNLIAPGTQAVVSVYVILKNS